MILLTLLLSSDLATWLLDEAFDRLNIEVRSIVGSQTLVNNETLSRPQSTCPVIDPIPAKSKDSGICSYKGKKKQWQSLHDIAKSVDRGGMIKEMSD